MTKKILIVGGGHAEIPLIQEAKNLGLYVITTGNNSDGLGHRFADKYVQADFSDHQQILNVAKSNNIDAICAGCNDFAAITASYVAEELSLPGHDSLETTLAIHHKDNYRALAEECNIRSPKAKGFTSISDAIQYAMSASLPLIVKPVDLTGGKGISIIEDYTTVTESIEKAFEISKAKRIVIETYISGSRHGLSIFLTSGKVEFYFSDNEHYYKNPYLVSAASTPSSTPKGIEALVCAEAQTLIKHLDLQTGIFHIQYILDKNTNIPYIIEICRRPPGDLYIEFIKISTGVNIPELIIRNAAGLKLPQKIETHNNGHYSRHCIMGDKNGKIENIFFDESIKNMIVSSLIWKSKGDIIENYLVEKCGIVFLKFSDFQQMNKTTEHLQELIKVHINPVN